jgi:recombination protein RecR
MSLTPGPVGRLIEELSRLPGIGPKTASRLTYFLLRAPEPQVMALAEAIRGLRQGTVLCNTCYSVAEQSPCPVCASAERDRGVICVVEEPLDLLAIERTRRFRGIYHVLHGALSPVDGIGPDELRMRELVERVRAGGVREVLLATNPTMEGDATAMYLARQLAPLGVRVTRLAMGLPVGGDLEYADEVTLGEALEGRREV